MAIALVEHQTGGLLFELRGKRTSLLAHQTPLHGDHSRLNQCPDSLDHYSGIVAEYGLTPEQVFGRKRAKPNDHAAQPVAAKYQDPKTGLTWSGRGRAPGWIKGKNRDRFLIQA
ncbi:H-NS histone [Burkholderia multivorans]|uniref:H-NS histone family protein n=1 Tax=Burkholderia multivorans TaxID=87883 RepID=UPI000CFEBE16|nr:H-NS histone family protein [Burkholderia multivorans]PRG59025.1 H-NS histone [Burkholderia multivorans]